MSDRVNAIIAKSGISFGTSGARGLVEQFTPDVCAAFTAAFLAVMKEDAAVCRVAIGVDRRPSSPGMAAACTAAAQAMGIDVLDYGVLPTPALALQAMKDGIPAIMVTGSHIPFDRNGIKFYRPEGEISKVDEQAILDAALPTPKIAEIKRVDTSDLAITGYQQRYTQWFTGRPLAGVRIGLYQHSAAGRDLNQQVLADLGAEVVVLGRSEVFVPVDTEAVSDEDLALGVKWSFQYQLDAILTTDGDGDRPLLADENGHWLRGDIVGLLCARALGVQALAIPVSCNTAIEQSGAFSKVVRTRIGSPYVLAEMQELATDFKCVAGFEANGGFMLGSMITEGERQLAALPTRDALLPALTILVEAAKQKKPLSEIVRHLPARYTVSDRLKDIPAAKSQALLAAWSQDPSAMVQALGLSQPIGAVNLTDGLRVSLLDGNVVHLRPSGNAPELRCYAEADSTAKAQALVTNTLNKIPL
ncbi:phosphomannomutase [Marinobacterium sp. YM272]|uniref:phosphomannomutase n=1 Tax=Marinobacterium sp. YM272 TaxID=3421654 RepID=UPI003D7FA8C2